MSLEEDIKEVDKLSDQLCGVIDGDFDITVELDTPNEVLQKLCMLINFLLDCSRKSVLLAEDQKKKLEDSYWELQTNNEQMMIEIEIRKETEEKLAETHQQMLEVSRKAGMTEVTNSILHNVGNVLNSLNTSVDLLIKNYKGSKLDKAGSLIPEVEKFEKIAEFITENPKSDAIIKYIIEIFKTAQKREESSLAEMQKAKEMVEHIRSIIQAQQNNAKQVSFTEPVQIKAIIDESYHLVKNSYEKSGVTFETGEVYNEEIITDKHRIMQILVNLIKNAKDAMEDQESEKKVIVSTKVQDDILSILVSDTGQGISKENLTKIFNHGFTTKKTGHGFGLHSCANAAGELGGSLECDSEGEGKGATFILNIPIKR